MKTRAFALFGLLALTLLFQNCGQNGYSAVAFDSKGNIQDPNNPDNQLPEPSPSPSLSATPRPSATPTPTNPTNPPTPTPTPQHCEFEGVDACQRCLAELAKGEGWRIYMCKDKSRSNGGIGGQCFNTAESSSHGFTELHPFQEPSQGQVFCNPNLSPRPDKGGYDWFPGEWGRCTDNYRRKTWCEW